MLASLLVVLRSIAFGDPAFLGKLAVGALLMSTSFPRPLAQIRWLQWLMFGAGVELLAWAFFSGYWFYGVAVTVVVMSLVGVVWDYTRGDLAGAERSTESAFETTEGGETLVEGGSISGYDRISKTSRRGRAVFRNSNISRRKDRD